MGLQRKRPEKTTCGTLRLYVTIPAELADEALKLYDSGFNQNDWAKEGIVAIKQRTRSVI